MQAKSRLLSIDSLIFVFMLASSFWVYRYSMAGLPRADHLPFIFERQFVNSEWDFIARTISFSFSSDYFLFRPFFHLLLAVRDIFLQHNLYAVGITALALHAVTCFVFYLFISRLVGKIFGFLFALLLLIQYSGLEMIHWTHINPYMAGLSCLMIGYVLILDQRFGRLLILTMTIVALFHEFFALMLFGTSFVVFIADRALDNTEKDADQPGTKKIMANFLIPFLIYIAWDLVDFKYFNFQAHGYLKGEPLGNVDLSNVFASAYQIFQILPLVFFVPNVIKLTQLSPTSHVIWDITSVPKFWGFLSGVIGSVLICFALGIFLLGLKKSKTRPASLVGVSLMVLYFGIIAAPAVASASLKISSYFETSTYYYYIVRCIFLSWFGLVASILFDGRGRKIFLSVTILLLLWQVPFSYYQIQKFSRPSFSLSDKIAANTLTIHEHIQERPDYCYAGCLSSADLCMSIFDSLLFRDSCINRADKTPLYAILTDRGVEFEELPERSEPSVGKQEINFFSTNFLELPPHKLMLWFFKLPPDFKRFHMRVRDAVSAGFALQVTASPRILVGVYDDHAGLTVFDFLKPFKNNLPGARGAHLERNSYLSLEKIRGNFFLFQGDFALINLGNVDEFDSEVFGVYCQPASAQDTNPCFDETLVW